MDECTNRSFASLGQSVHCALWVNFEEKLEDLVFLEHHF